MAEPGEIIPAPESPVYGASPRTREESETPMSHFQEINARRARVENAEALRNLRSL